jgi:DNA-binding TFAR19-related protein (PDSD5 family)
MTTFGDLRSAVHRVPSRENFQHVIALLEGADASEEAVRDEWIPYLASSLTSWPDDARACGEAFVKALELEDRPWSGLVRTLDYEGATLSEERVRAIAAAAHLSHIERLDLKASRITWPLLGELVESAPFGKLKSFALRKSTSSGVDAEVFPALLASPMLSDLEELDFFSWGKVTGKVFETVLETLPLGRLRKLDISETKVSAAALRKLFARGEVSGLEDLRLARLKVPLRAFEQATHLGNLRRLDLNAGGLSLDDMTAIPAHMVGLERLDLINSIVASPSAMGLFLSPEAYPRLTRLDLNRNAMGRQGFAMFAEATCFPALEELDLEYCGLEDLSALERMEGFPSLKRLVLDGNKVSPGHWAHLTRAPFFGGLTHLSMDSDQGLDSPEHYEALFEVDLPTGLESLRTYVAREESVVMCLEALSGVEGLRTLHLPRPVRWRSPLGSLQDATVEAVVNHPALAGLRDLDLARHDPTRAQVERLLEGLPELERLKLGKVTDEGIWELAEEWAGRCAIRLSRR